MAAISSSVPMACSPMSMSTSPKDNDKPSKILSENILSPQMIQQGTKPKIRATTEINCAKVLTRTISILGAATLGIFSGLVVMGTLVTPVGWGVAGAALVIGLASSVAYGGKKELLTALKFSATSYMAGFGVGLMFGASFATPVGISIAKTGGGVAAAYWGGFASYVTGIAATTHMVQNSPL